MKPSANRKGLVTKQQATERHYFEMFRKVHPLTPGTITYGDKPDVVLVGTQKIGIEITRFYVVEGTSSGSEQVQRNRRKAAVSKGQRIYEQSGGTNIMLTLGFDRGHPIRDVDALAEKLVVFAHRLKGRDSGPISKDVYKEIPELDFAYLLASELQYRDEPDSKFPNGQPDPSQDFRGFREYRNRRDERALRDGIYKPLQTTKWRLSQLHSFGLMSTERLASIIREKEARARHYATCDAYWLLIVVDFNDSAQEQEIRIDGITIESDVFERVIVYKPAFDHINEIAVQPVSAL
jgi:hypothetical protein